MIILVSLLMLSDRYNSFKIACMPPFFWGYRWHTSRPGSVLHAERTWHATSALYFSKILQRTVISIFWHFSEIFNPFLSDHLPSAELSPLWTKKNGLGNKKKKPVVGMDRLRGGGGGGGGALECQEGYQVCPKIHVIRVVFQDQALYARTSFRVQKHAKLEKRVCFWSYRQILEKTW